MQDQMTPTTVETIKKPKVRAQKKHVILFVIACLILVVGALVYVGGLVGWTGSVFDQFADVDVSESELPGLAALLLLLAVPAMLYAGILVMTVISTVFWIAGLIVSGILVFRKKALPTWMWVLSLILFCIYALFTLGNVATIAFWLISAILSKLM